MKNINLTIASAAFAILTGTAAVAETASPTDQTQTNNKELHQMAIENFAEKYVELWKTTDDTERATLAKELFTEDAAHYAAPANVSFQGREAIIANVTSVNKGAIQGAGLKFKSGPSVVNHNSILVEWSAEAPNGQTVRSGRDIMILNDEGKATLLYMFTSD